MRSPKAKQWKYILMLFLCCCMVFPLYVSAKATQSRTVKVAFPVQDGMSYFHPDGTPDGYNYVYLEKIAEYTGWKMEYIPYDSGDKNADIQNALNDLESGKVDLLGSILKNQYTEQIYVFPEQNYGTVYTTFCALETGNLREDNAASAGTLKVGLWKQAETRNQEVISYLDSENFDYELYYYDTYEEQYQALEDGNFMCRL